MDQKPIALTHDEADITERGLRPGGAAPVFVADACESEHRRVRLVSCCDRRRGRGRGLDHGGVIQRIAEIDCAVGEISLVVVVGDVHQRGLVMVGETGQHSQQCVPALLVDHAGDLVGNEQRRLPRQRSGHGQALQLPAGQAAGVAFGETCQPDFAQ